MKTVNVGDSVLMSDTASDMGQEIFHFINGENTVYIFDQTEFVLYVIGGFRYIQKNVTNFSISRIQISVIISLFIWYCYILFCGVYI